MERLASVERGGSKNMNNNPRPVSANILDVSHILVFSNGE